MNKLSFSVILISVILMAACQQNEDRQKQEPTRVKVKTTSVSYGVIPDYLSLTGKTIFLNKNTIVSPIAGYITLVNAKPGNSVHKGDTLFVLVSREAWALRDNKNVDKNFGKIVITAPSSGVINQLNVFKKFVFVDKNALLCDIVETGSLFIQTEIPYEYASLIKRNALCKVVLPNNQSFSAHFYKILPSVIAKSQTQKVLVKVNSSEAIPENLIVQVLINKTPDKETQILPKTCIMTDALMTKFWVMKLINDSTAVQTPVQIGKQNHRQAEIISPLFTKDDLFISQGAYGLSDTVLIQK